MNERTERFLRRLLGVPPSLEEVVANFQHKPGCSQIGILKRTEESKQEYIPGSGSWIDIGSVQTITRTFITCEECGVREQFSQ